MNKNVKHWYWELETDDTGSEPQTAVLEKLPSRTFADIPCPGSAGWFEGAIKAALCKRLTRPSGKIQAIVWGPEHAFKVEIAHRPASPLGVVAKEA